jgi:hypothetical protein
MEFDPHFGGSVMTSASICPPLHHSFISPYLFIVSVFHSFLFLSFLFACFFLLT